MKTKNIINLIRWDLISHQKAHFNSCIGLFGFAVITGIIWNFVGVSSMQPLGSLWGGLFVLVYILMLTNISSILHTKTDRISYLMLPASMNEKLVSRLLVCMVILPIPYIASILVGDIVQYLLNLVLLQSSDCRLYSGGFLAYVFSPFFGKGHFIIHFGNHEFSSLLWSFASFFSWISYLFMCGCLWSKHAVLKSFGLCAGLFIIFIGLMAMMGFLAEECGIIEAFKAYAESREHFNEDFWGFLQIIGLIFFICWSVICLWIGYRKFTNRQIIDTKKHWYGF